MINEDKSQISLTGVLVLLIFMAVAGVIIWQSNRSNVNAETTLERIQRTGTIRIGFANENPYGYLDTKAQKVTGEAPEIARHILKKMGVEKIEPVVAEFGSLIPGLKAKRFDMIAAGMYITPSRGQEIAFSNPTYAISESFIVLAGNPLQLHSYEDVRDNPKARLGVMGGSIELVYAKKLGIDESQIAIFADYASALQGLRGDQVDAVAATYLTVKDLLRKQDSSDIEQVADFRDPVIDGKETRGYGAFGFRKQDEALRERFNEELAKFIGTPEHLELVQPFDFDESTLPGEVTAKELTTAP